jgi:23S rRNA pseudouridine1911/1915/1917 synthase
VIVVNKPQGMVVHPAAGHPEPHFGQRPALPHQGSGGQSGGLSDQGSFTGSTRTRQGLLMVAKNAELRANHLEKPSWPPRATSDSTWRSSMAISAEEDGTIDAPIGRNPRDRKQMAVVENGKSCGDPLQGLRAVSRATAWSSASWRRAGPTRSGSTWTYIGHPLAGDPLYGPRKTLPGAWAVPARQDPGL